MQPGPIALPGCTYSVWVAQRTRDVTAVKDCAPRFSTNANNKPIANTNTCTQTEFVLKHPLMQHMFSCFHLSFSSSHPASESFTYVAIPKWKNTLLQMKVLHLNI